MTIDNNIPDERKTFLGTMRDRLAKERDFLESKIKDENYQDENNYKKSISKNSRANSVNKLQYTNDIPVFLKKADEQKNWQDPNKTRVDYNINTAMERYDKSIEKARKAVIASNQESEKKIEVLNRLIEKEAVKQKLNFMNEHEYLKLQMEENVR